MDEYLEHNSLEEEEGISLQSLFKIVWENIALIIIIGFWTVVLGIVYTFVIVTPNYTATSKLMIQIDVDNTSESEASLINSAMYLIGTYETLVVTDKVLEAVIEDVDGLEVESINALRDSISVSTQDRVLFIDLKVEHPDPEMAQTIVNSLAENSIEIANETETLKNRLTLHDEANLPINPSSPNKVLNIAISFILGGILALGVVFIKEALNNKFKSTDEIEKYLNIKVLASVPGTIKERKWVE
ncbi:MAG: YveK family protein [Bacillota bacterium]